MTFTSESLYQALPNDPPTTDTEEDIQLEPLIPDAETKYIFFVLGCALLLPWNGTPPSLSNRCSYLHFRRPVIITAVPFFLSRLKDSPHFSLTFSSYLTTSSSICNFVFLAHATFREKKVSFRWSVLGRIIQNIPSRRFLLHANPGE